MSAPYAAVAAKLHTLGWGVLHMPPGEKDPPPSGHTGRDGVDLDLDDVLKIAEESPDANVALRMPPGVMGIDVDAYDGKPGPQTLKALERECGPLPATWVLTSREDGVSGIRLYRVPRDYEAAGEAGPGIEILQRHHRYAMTAPSVHPEGRVYGCYGRDGQPCETPPRPDELPELPAVWRTAIRSNGGAGAKADLDDEQTEELLGRWATAGEPDDAVARVLGQATAALHGGGSRHDAAMYGVSRLVRLGQQGHAGVKTALAALEKAFRLATEARDPGEWRRLVVGAVALVAGGGEEAETNAASVERGDLLIADRFVAEAGDDFRYVPGLDWHRWTGAAWRPCEKLEHVEGAKAVVRRVLADDGVDPKLISGVTQAGRVRGAQM